MTLEELKQKRKEINEQIKRLENADFFQCGNAKIDKQHYATQKPDEYMICVRYEPVDGKGKWVSVARNVSKEDVINKIPEIIKDLKGLYDALVDSENKNLVPGMGDWR